MRFFLQIPLQVYEKAVIDQGERDYDNGFAQNVQAMTALRGSLEAEEAALRKVRCYGLTLS